MASTMNVKQLFAASMLLCVSGASFAAAQAWELVPASSKITFTATQNGAPVTGLFKTFSGDIHFDPKQLSESNVDLTVDLNSVSTSFAQVADTLKTDDWFDIKLFPKALFQANKFTQAGAQGFQSDGTLHLRDKTLPVVLTFNWNEAGNKATVKGSTTLKRTQFGIGQGEWSDTSQVKDDVKVDFDLTVVKK